MRELILASTSKYRKLLLERLGIAFRGEAPICDEAASKNLGLTPAALASKLALEKANSLLAKYPHAVIVGSDQVVACDGAALSKPGTIEKACEQLGLLSGKRHELLTAFAVVSSEQTRVGIERATVTLRKLTKAQIARYVAEEDVLDCAGSYRFEEKGIRLFASVTTSDPNAIVGLPLIQLTSALIEFGYELP